jgi:hypothetical protein
MPACIIPKGGTEHGPYKRKVQAMFTTETGKDDKFVLKVCLLALIIQLTPLASSLYN